MNKRPLSQNSFLVKWAPPLWMAFLLGYFILASFAWEEPMPLPPTSSSQLSTISGIYRERDVPGKGLSMQSYLETPGEAVPLWCARTGNLPCLTYRETGKRVKVVNLRSNPAFVISIVDESSGKELRSQSYQVRLLSQWRESQKIVRQIFWVASVVAVLFAILTYLAYRNQTKEHTNV